MRNMSKIIALACFAALSFAQTAPDGPGITVDAGAPLLHRAPVFRMPGVTAGGDVVVEASVDSKGEVTDARVVSGPLELRRAALQSVLQWHYSTEQGLPPSVRVTIHFGEQAVSSGIRGGLVAGIVGVPPSAMPMTIGNIEILGVSPEIAQMVRDRIPVHVGDQAGPEIIGRVMAAARQIDEHFQVDLREEFFAKGQATLRISIASGATAPNLVSGGIVGGVPGGIWGGVAGGVSGGVSAGRVVLDPGVASENLVSKVTPAYPPLAKQARIQGAVHLSAVIGTDGAVRNLQVISGHPLLVPAALEAVKQWVYKPTLRDGKPTEVATQVTVNFTLEQ
jgi:TonB family protein